MLGYPRKGGTPMSEKSSSFERVVGSGLEEADKVNILRSMAERFDDQKFEELEGLERKKNSEELQIISLTNEATNALRRTYGLESFTIPADNIHIVEAAKWQEEVASIFSPLHQGIVMEEERSRLVLAERTFHELVHFKSYGALHIREEDRVLDEYRSGLVVRRRSDGKHYFDSLNEAVTEELTKRFIESHSDNPLFKEEIEATAEIKKQNPDAVDSEGNPFFREDTFYVSVTGEKEGEKLLEGAEFTYREEREVLHVLIDKLYQKKTEEFRDREEVFDLFARSMFTGNILPLGRLIDRTFGKGTFRKIGEAELEEQKRIVEQLP